MQRQELEQLLASVEKTSRRLNRVEVVLSEICKNVDGSDACIKPADEEVEEKSTNRSGNVEFLQSLLAGLTLCVGAAAYYARDPWHCMVATTVCITLSITTNLLARGGHIEERPPRKQPAFQPVLQATPVMLQWMQEFDRTISSELRPPPTSGDAAASVADRIFSSIDFHLSRREYDQGIAALEALASGGQATFSRAELLWRRAAFLVQKAGSLERKSEAQREMYLQALETAEDAVETDSDCAPAHQWVAACLGICTEFWSLTKQLECVWRIRDHAVRAVELDPALPTPHHVLGQWCYKVANASWFQRRAARMIYSKGVPEATFEEALDYLVEAERLSKDFWHENKLVMGKCYQKLGNANAARQCFEAVATAPRGTQYASSGSAIEKARAML